MIYAAYAKQAEARASAEMAELERRRALLTDAQRAEEEKREEAARRVAEEERKIYEERKRVQVKSGVGWCCQRWRWYQR